VPDSGATNHMVNCIDYLNYSVHPVIFSWNYHTTHANSSPGDLHSPHPTLPGVPVISSHQLKELSVSELEDGMGKDRDDEQWEAGNSWDMECNMHKILGTTVIVTQLRKMNLIGMLSSMHGAMVSWTGTLVGGNGLDLAAGAQCSHCVPNSLHLL
jgi:hypothetical protein